MRNEQPVYDDTPKLCVGGAEEIPDEVSNSSYVCCSLYGANNEKVMGLAYDDVAEKFKEDGLLSSTFACIELKSYACGQIL
jgi:hypothetical protein